MALHKCNIMNKSPVISMSLHPSGKMLLALYDNGVLRLWNMMEARCNFKRKVGVIEEDEEAKHDEEQSESDADLGIKEIGPKDLKEAERKPIAVKWEPSKSSSYAILYNRMLEIYNLADPTGSDQACATAIFDKTVCCMEFVGQETIVVSDMEGNLIVLKHILSQETLQMNIFRTKFPKIRSLKTFYNRKSAKFEHVVGVSTDSKIAIWTCK